VSDDWEDTPRERRQQDATDPRLNDLWVYRLGIVEQDTRRNTKELEQLHKQMIALPQNYVPRREQDAQEDRDVTVRLQRPVIIFAGAQCLLGVATVLKLFGAF
jgi:hypothetical protein